MRPISQGIKKYFRHLPRQRVSACPFFVIGELYAGFKGGTREKDNRRLLNSFLKKSSVITIDASVETADFFGVIKNSLKQAGRPIPINDVWIAAHALEHGAVVVTRDKHFHWIPGLRLWDHS